MENNIARKTRWGHMSSSATRVYFLREVIMSSAENRSADGARVVVTVPNHKLKVDAFVIGRCRTGLFRFSGFQRIQDSLPEALYHSTPFGG